MLDEDNFQILNPYIPGWGHIWSNSEHIHASDKYISSFISVRSFTGKVRVKNKENDVTGE